MRHNLIHFSTVTEGKFIISLRPGVLDEDLWPDAPLAAALLDGDDAVPPADAVVGLVADVRRLRRGARVAPDGVRLARRQAKLLWGNLC